MYRRVRHASGPKGVVLADEMGLGKTVQVMALIAHLMEEKGNFGPHLIVVPNAVLVNWRAEMTTWLPGALIHARLAKLRLCSDACFG